MAGVQLLSLFQSLLLEAINEPFMLDSGRVVEMILEEKKNILCEYYRGVNILKREYIKIFNYFLNYHIKIIKKH